MLESEDRTEREIMGQYPTKSNEYTPVGHTADKSEEAIMNRPLEEEKKPGNLPTNNDSSKQ